MKRGGDFMGYLLLTGFTGLLGRYLARDLLIADEPLAVLSRRDEMSTAAERVEAIMSMWDERIGRSVPRPVVLEGDITAPDLGLDRASRQWVAQHCDRVLHNAASLTFQTAGPEAEPWLSNVQGTRNVLELCRAAKIRQFHHVSTAYVCGARQGLNLESELDVGQQWGNDYERSKVEAEKLVRSAEFLDGPTFHRPSIILGDSRTGYTSTFHAFYAPLQLACLIAAKLDWGDPRPDERLRVLSMMNMRGDETKNFVPVDWVSSVMTAIVRTPSLHGATYHLTNPQPATVSLMQDVVLEAVRPLMRKSPAPAAVPNSDLDLASMFRDKLRVYESYWRDDPKFDCRATQAAFPQLPCPVVDREMLLKFAKYAISTGFGWPRKRPPVPVFDAPQFVADRFQRSDSGPAEVGDRWVGLQVNGSGGGQWGFRMRGEQACEVRPGVCATDEVKIYLGAETMSALVGGSLTAQQAVDSGRMILDGEDADRWAAMHLLEQFSAESRLAPQ
jgi:thioester reductase-like protein